MGAIACHNSGETEEVKLFLNWVLAFWTNWFFAKPPKKALLMDFVNVWQDDKSQDTLKYDLPLMVSLMWPLMLHMYLSRMSNLSSEIFWVSNAFWRSQIWRHFSNFQDTVSSVWLSSHVWRYLNALFSPAEMTEATLNTFTLNILFKRFPFKSQY